MTRRSLWILGALGVGLLVALVLLSAYATRVAESRLRTGIGPGRWRVQGLQFRWGWLVGRIGDLQVDGQNVTLRSGLVLERVHLEFEDLHGTPLGVTSVGVIRYAVDVFAQDLSDSVSRKGHVDFVPRVTLLEGQVKVQAEERHLHIPIPGLEMTGTVRIAEGVYVEFVPDSLNVGHMQAGSGGLALLGTAINPLLDTRTLPYGLTISHVEIHPDAMHVDGEAHPQFPLPVESHPHPTDS